MTDHPSALVSVPVDAVNTLKRHIPSLDAAATPTLGALFVVCGQEAREMHDAIAMLAAAPAAPQAAGVGEDDGAWIIVFEDRDREQEVFTGFGARDAAQSRYDQVTVSWNAHLFERVRSALPLRAPSREPEGGAVDERLKWFLKVIEGAGGEVCSTESRHNPINVFCEDRDEGDDTFNISEAAGYTQTSHDTSFDTSTTRITDKGRAYLAALATREEAPAEAGVPSLVDWFSQFIERHQEGCGSDTDALIACLDRVRDSYRTQPQAREDAQPVSCQSCGGEVQGWVCQGCDMTFCERDGRLIAEHPATDALRAAVGALEELADEASPYDKADEPLSVRIAKDLTRRIEIASQALAALQAEQGAK